jgi:hypothetical protein
VFVDESGNLGFTDKSAKFFIVAYIVCESPLKVRTAMRRALKVLQQDKKYHYSENELKFSHMNQKSREYVLQKISECDLSVNTVVVEKAKINPNLRNDIPKLYNYLVVHNIVLSFLPQLISNKKIDITFDKTLSKKRVEDFNDYVKKKASFLLNEKNTKFEPAVLLLSHVNSISEPCLQAADAVAGAYFQKYENKNNIYVDIITDKVGSFNYLWK